MSTYGDQPSHPNEPPDGQPGQTPVPPPGPPPAVPPPDSGGGDPFAASFGTAESVSFGAGTTTTVVPDLPPRRRRRRGVVIGGVAAAVILVAAGVAFAVSELASGGAQPESVVPASAIAYGRIDLDPSAGQKVAAFRFLRKFPSVTKDGTSDGDLIDQVLRTALKDDRATISYDNDVKPWLGKRAGIAALPGTGGDSVQTLVVIQVKDEGKARTSLRKLLDDAAAKAVQDGSYASSSSDSGYCPAPTGDGVATSCVDTSPVAPVASTPKPSGLVVRDGYALIGPDQATTQKLSDAAASASLADSATYKTDMARIGEPGVASAWVDLDAVRERAGGDSLGAASALTGGSGRFVAAVRFGGGNAELVAKGFGGKAVPAGTPAGSMLAALPAGTTGGLAVGGTEQYAQQLADVLKGLGTAGSSSGATFGLTLPGDLEKLLGTGFVVAVGDVTADPPQVAVRVRTPDAAGSRAVLDTALASARRQTDGFLTIPTIVDAPATDGLVYGVDSDYAATVAANGTLGQDPGFQSAVPDAATATSAGYVDFDKVSIAVTDPEARKNVDPLSALGLTVRVSGTDTEIHVRLVAG